MAITIELSEYNHILHIKSNISALQTPFYSNLDRCARITHQAVAKGWIRFISIEAFLKLITLFNYTRQNGFELLFFSGITSACRIWRNALDTSLKIENGLL